MEEMKLAVFEMRECRKMNCDIDHDKDFREAFEKAREAFLKAKK